MPDVVGIGALNMDRVYLVERIGAAGEEIKIDSVSEESGGSAANTIAGLAGLGVTTGFVGRVGDDPDGARIRSGMEREGVDVTGIEVAQGMTGVAIVLVDRRGERAIYLHPGVNDTFRMTHENLACAKSAKFLHLSSFASETSLAAQKEILSRSEARISFAPGMLYSGLGTATLMEILSRAEVVFLNRDEIGILMGSDYRNGARELNLIGAAIVVVTLGGGGCYIRSGGVEISIPASAADVIDTTGAGDAFSAGFLAGLLKGEPLDRCGRIGNGVAARCVEAVGARAWTGAVAGMKIG